MKYIIFQDFSDQPIPIIFPNRIDFAEFREGMPYSVVLSAGMVELKDGQFRCFGQSKLLGVSAREEDAAIIAGRFEPREEQ